MGKQIGEAMPRYHRWCGTRLFVGGRWAVTLGCASVSYVEAV